MKKIIAFLICMTLMLSLAACGSSPAAPAGTEAGTISVTRVATEISRNGADEAKLEYIYDDAGICIEVVSYLNGTEVLRATPTCDEQGNILSKTYSTFGATFTDTYTYDENGKILTYAKTDSADNLVYGFESIPHEISEFTSRTMTIVMPTGTMIQRMENTFDENGYTIRQDIYMNDVLSEYYEVTNDELGRVVFQAGFSADGSPTVTTEFTYDGNTKTGVNKAPDGTVMNEMEVLMDDEGRTLDNKVTMNGSVMNHQSFTYQTFKVPAA